MTLYHPESMLEPEGICTPQHDHSSISDFPVCIQSSRNQTSPFPHARVRQSSRNNPAEAPCDQGNTTDLASVRHLDGVAYDPTLGTQKLSPSPEERQQPQPSVNTSLGGHEIMPRPRNVVVFGDTGAGKSSVINAITQSQSAEVSIDGTECTLRYRKYEVNISGEEFSLFDTAGLNGGAAVEARIDLDRLMSSLRAPGSDGVHLFVYCVRSGRIKRALVENYKLLCSIIQQESVPVALVLTGLENQPETMESWWEANEWRFHEIATHIKDHVCITTLVANLKLDTPASVHRIRDSSEILRNFILKNCSERPLTTPIQYHHSSAHGMLLKGWRLIQNGARRLFTMFSAARDPRDRNEEQDI